MIDWVEMKELYGNLKILPDYDEAVIGIGNQATQETIVIYCYNIILKILMSKEKMDSLTAMSHLDYNIAGGYEGKDTPLIVKNCFVHNVCRRENDV
jgi:hypothetical protein|tara:strand:- start:457 stop:744 length:288 start_codon:yes stop_codon:yes gene_type:complete